jgi:hypothetical protein
VFTIIIIFSHPRHHKDKPFVLIMEVQHHRVVSTHEAAEQEQARISSGDVERHSFRSCSVHTLKTDCETHNKREATRLHWTRAPGRAKLLPMISNNHNSAALFSAQNSPFGTNAGTQFVAAHFGEETNAR